MPDRYFFVGSQETINGVVYLPGISYRIHGKDEFKLHELRSQGRVVFSERARDFNLSYVAHPFGVKINLDAASADAVKADVTVTKTAKKVSKEEKKEKKSDDEGSLP